MTSSIKNPKEWLFARMFFAYSCSVFAFVECAGGYVIEEKNIFLKREMDDHKNIFSLRTNSRIIFFIYL